MILTDVSKAVELLERTPYIIIDQVKGLSDDVINQNEGGDSWSPFIIVGHLIHGEKTDWIPRMNIILSDIADKRFTPYDRFAQFEESKGKSMDQLLDEFKLLRTRNLSELSSRNPTKDDLEKQGIHPVFGKVTLSQLLAAWVAHDLTHIAQIARALAHAYKVLVGPFADYLRILQTSDSVRRYETINREYTRSVD
jgi:hypothetical protein